MTRPHPASRPQKAQASLNCDSFLNKEGVFTPQEKDVIAESCVEGDVMANYVALTGEKVFLLDVEGLPLLTSG